MDDINRETGVTQFVQNSHFFEDPNYSYQDRWSNKDIISLFGDSSIIAPSLSFGQALFLDTLQIHRGSRPINKDRTVIIANFCAHQELTSKGQLQPNPDLLDNLDKYQRLVFC